VLTEKTPLDIGLRAARANLVPGLMIQAGMIALVIGYYFSPAVHAPLEALAAAKQREGYLFSCVSSMIAGGVLPMMLTIVVFQKGKWRASNFGDFCFLLLFWGFQGMAVDLFYRSQAVWFGSAVNFQTVAKKVLVDQLFYSALFAAPFGMACYEWKNRGYSTTGLSRVFTISFYKNKTFPTVIANWGVWFPVVAVIYSLPSLLQVPLFCLALTFWSMLFTTINAHHAAKL
jgi:hypothetical protein